MKNKKEQIAGFASKAWYKTKQILQWYKNLYIGTPWWKKTIAVFVSLLITFILYLGAVDINLFWLFGKSPGFSRILNPETSTASEIYSADSVLIGKFFNENRTPVSYEEVNPMFWKCLIDTEDERFYSHHGIDFLGLFGAAKDAITGHGGRGASTITQQLAKNMFRVRSQYSTGIIGKIPGLKILIVKTKEWIIATKLEMCYDKNDILRMYANTVDFGSGAYGIKTAAKTYFKTTPKDLTIEQSAVLVGMLKATTFYNPKNNPKNSLQRRNQVLENMLTHGHITRAECDSLKQIEIKLSYTVEKNYDGQAQYFREAVANELSEWCDENGYDLYTSGLKIYTTIDSRMQRYAEDAVAKQMKVIQRNFKNHWGNREPWVDEKGNTIPNFIDDIVKRQPVYKYLTAKYPNNPDSVDYYLNTPHPVKVFTWDNDQLETTLDLSVVDSVKYMVKFMHCAFVAMEPQTGEVKAYVGDISFRSWKYDKARAQRQPGSTFKLFVYTEAMNQGLTPCDKRRDEFFSMDVWDAKKKESVRWTPSNADGVFSGDSMPLKSAFAKSINSVAVRLGQEMGIRRIAETAYKMGIKSPLDESAPSLALGSSDINLLELTNAYCTVADDGKHHETTLVTKIVDSKGAEVYVAPNTSEQAISYKSAFLMQKMLQAGMREPGGTSMSLWGYVGKANDTDFGGKTGTSNNHSDAWFMGVSPKLVVGAWVGGEYRSIHFRTGALGQGSRTALPICGLFLQSVMNDPAFKHYHGHFNKPKDPGITSSMYECSSYYSQRNDTIDVDSVAVENDIEAIEHEENQCISAGEGEHRPIEKEIKLEDL